MSEVLEFAGGASSSNDRRRHARQRLRSLAYAELDQENGGIVLDASESGVSVHAVVALTDEVLPRLRLRLPDSTAWVETRARVVWTLESGKVAGLQFEDLPESARDQIREWLSREASPFESEGAYPSAPTEQRLVADLQSEATANGIGDDQGSPTAMPVHGGSSAGQAKDGAESAEAVPEATSNAMVSERGASPVAIAVPLASTQQTTGVIDEAARRPPPAPYQQISQLKFLPEEPRNTAMLYLLLILLAVASLTSGWAAGRGKFRPLGQKIRQLIAQTDASGPVPTLPDKQMLPPVKDIEILDANDHHWTISLLGVSSPSAPAMPKTGALGGEAEPDGKQRLNFQIWTLSPPQRSAASGDANAMRGSAPPAVEESKGAPEIAPVASSPIEATSPEALPKPENMVGVLKRGALIHRVEPNYPEIARQQNVAGTVTLQATVGADGAVREVRVISGPKLLIQSAVNAVRQWRYAPTFLDGKAIETEVEISLVFRLSNGSF